MLQILNKKSPSKNLHSNTKITTASEQSLSLPLSANYYAISFLWLNSSLLANNEKAIMAKLCSYYPLHFMQAVIIVNPRGLLYHVRGSREENGVGWCMANWKCHSYLFISTTRPLLCARVCVRTHVHVRVYTCAANTRGSTRECPSLAHTHPRLHVFFYLQVERQTYLLPSSPLKITNSPVGGEKK